MSEGYKLVQALVKAVDARAKAEQGGHRSDAAQEAMHWERIQRKNLMDYIAQLERERKSHGQGADA